MGIRSGVISLAALLLASYTFNVKLISEVRYDHRDCVHVSSEWTRCKKGLIAAQGIVPHRPEDKTVLVEFFPKQYEEGFGIIVNPAKCKEQGSGWYMCRDIWFGPLAPPDAKPYYLLDGGALCPPGYTLRGTCMFLKKASPPTM